MWFICSIGRSCGSFVVCIPSPRLACLVACQIGRYGGFIVWFLARGRVLPGAVGYHRQHMGRAALFGEVGGRHARRSGWLRSAQSCHSPSPTHPRRGASLPIRHCIVYIGWPASCTSAGSCTSGGRRGRTYIGRLAQKIPHCGRCDGARVRVASYPRKLGAVPTHMFEEIPYAHSVSPET